jgi:LAO/AO transport system kinase
MWNPPIVKTIATESKGIEDLAAAIENFGAFQKQEDTHPARRRSIARWRLLELLRERLLADLLAVNGTGEKLDRLAAEVAEKRSDPYSAVEKIIRDTSSQK